MEYGWFEGTLETLWELENDIAELTNEYHEYMARISDVFTRFTKCFQEVLDGLRGDYSVSVINQFYASECQWLVFRSGEFHEYEFNIHNGTIICAGTEYKFPFSIVPKFKGGCDLDAAKSELREWVNRLFAEFCERRVAFMVSGALRDMDAEEEAYNAKLEQLKSLAAELGFTIVDQNR